MNEMIRIEGLRRTFGAVTALDSISFSVPEGSVLGLLGPNGSGKTTTVSILSTLLTPDSGRAEVAGFDVVRDAARARESISLTGQFAALDQALTVRENIALFGRLTGLRRGDLAGRTSALAQTYGLGEFLDRRVGALSGGMRRRVDIACALVTRPRVLFLDEPTTGLDPQSRAAVWDAVRALRADGITVLMTTQYLAEADELADDVVVLGAGRVLAQGSPAELKHRAGASRCEIVLVEPGRVDGVVARLSARGHDAHRAADGVVVVAAPDGQATLLAVLGLLTDVPLVSAGLRPPSLDEVFLQLIDDDPEQVTA
ncbi:Daunorubicin resistance ABC transporter ATPase subunit OS=Tsukamurella paurometabola (strain ATCC 8368 / DSM / CCUG 35730 / CIP 100753 / JCM 10117 / KCTC 9821 / NBRC 16120 / NCIMB 702349 / NCTC 13040) OX=521096 GN=Tpau_4329 PE=4 SV=1 [Tsukamurella paurometabola]|uniref:Daunorubicin resistance ABC transporter ATPase subunit n=1 Tax=Tsukamurella paurometabola (strain ATCC 8368 / DSM 20162 / CCUG 35730 / CIP 100753 / JCM 10117 / KCTC 9821 / NBRC 16120 / NCIMB 702349 / NCTC 13040) TaxID=521096 RepID=D5UZ43_TSUPD|nr:daunorubicin/doxorubicin resistance ABC transporter ATP-binding protein DrrA [Tsukamurella paurometabola]ADG80890.1 daunorubicin resistance ABC transporter ATPase subunit [Tsukamurella paurometabola DSM 20162]SUQ39256.1 Doxorubicin resistance ATP-binding protein DrrA [Tsukamurella paurometabola]